MSVCGIFGQSPHGAVPRVITVIGTFVRPRTLVASGPPTVASAALDRPPANKPPANRLLPHTKVRRDRFEEWSCDTSDTSKELICCRREIPNKSPNRAEQPTKIPSRENSRNGTGHRAIRPLFWTSPRPAASLSRIEGAGSPEQADGKSPRIGRDNTRVTTNPTPVSAARAYARRSEATSCALGGTWTAMDLTATLGGGNRLR